MRFPLRKKLHEQCMARPSKCLHYKPRGEIGRMNQTGIYEVPTHAALPAPECYACRVQAASTSAALVRHYSTFDGTKFIR